MGVEWEASVAAFRMLGGLARGEVIPSSPRPSAPSSSSSSPTSSTSPQKWATLTIMTTPVKKPTRVAKVFCQLRREGTEGGTEEWGEKREQPQRPRDFGRSSAPLPSERPNIPSFLHFSTV